MDSESIVAAVQLAARLQASASEVLKPPSEIAPSRDDPVIYAAMVRGTRGYIERVVHQVNGAYCNGWYDACAVMLRRLFETLIIECFEKHDLQEKIKDPAGNYLFLRDLIDATLTEPAWTLGRHVRAALPKLKDVGDKSAHSRRFNAHREDIDKLLKEIREAVQELLAIACLK